MTAAARRPEPKPVMLAVQLRCVICGQSSDQLCVRTATRICTKCQPIYTTPIEERTR